MTTLTKNCDTWGTYEEPNTTETSKLCHGGWYDGSLYTRCASAQSCRSETYRRSGKTFLPVVREGTTMSSRILAATGGSVPSTLPTRTQGSGVVPQLARPIASPPTGNPYLDTPQGGRNQANPAPVFLPRKSEGVFRRLFKNFMQGIVSGLGIQTYDYANQVDMFPHKEKEEEPPPAQPPTETL